jgi:hypothetical protein
MKGALSRNVKAAEKQFEIGERIRDDRSPPPPQSPVPLHDSKSKVLPIL